MRKNKTKRKKKFFRGGYGSAGDSIKYGEEIQARKAREEEEEREKRKSENRKKQREDECYMILEEQRPDPVMIDTPHQQYHSDTPNDSMGKNWDRACTEEEEKAKRYYGFTRLEKGEDKEGNIIKLENPEYDWKILPFTFAPQYADDLPLRSIKYREEEILFMLMYYNKRTTGHPYANKKYPYNPQDYPNAGELLSVIENLVKSYIAFIDNDEYNRFTIKITNPEEKESIEKKYKEYKKTINTFHEAGTEIKMQPETQPIKIVSHKTREEVEAEKAGKKESETDSEPKPEPKQQSSDIFKHLSSEQKDLYQQAKTVEVKQQEPKPEPKPEPSTIEEEQTGGTIINYKAYYDTIHRLICQVIFYWKPRYKKTGWIEKGENEYEDSDTGFTVNFHPVGYLNDAYKRFIRCINILLFDGSERVDAKDMIKQLTSDEEGNRILENLKQGFRLSVEEEVKSMVDELKEELKKEESEIRTNLIENKIDYFKKMKIMNDHFYPIIHTMLKEKPKPKPEPEPEPKPEPKTKIGKATAAASRSLSKISKKFPTGTQVLDRILGPVDPHAQSKDSAPGLKKDFLEVAGSFFGGRKSKKIRKSKKHKKGRKSKKRRKSKKYKKGRKSRKH